MAADGFLFNGVFSRRPRVAVKLNIAGLGPLSVGSPKIVAIIGQASGGTPGVPLSFTDPGTATQVLRDGDLLRAVRRCFNPSTDPDALPGASVIIAIRLNPATQAKANLVDATPTAVINLTAQNYGQLDNQIFVAVAAGTTTGKKITVTNPVSGVTTVGDNLTRKAFTIKYGPPSPQTTPPVGTGTTCTMTIDNTLNKLTTTVAGGAASDTLNLDLTQYPTIGALAAAIAANPAYTVTGIDPVPSDPALQGLDSVSAQDIKTANYNVMANLQAIVDWLNGPAQTSVTAARVGGVGTLPANTAAPVYLANGAEVGTTHLDGTAVTTPWATWPNSLADWNYCLGQLGSQTVQIVVPVYGSTGASGGEDAILALVNQHCQSMSANGLYVRRGISGAMAGEAGAGNTAQVVAHAVALNSDRMEYIPQGIVDFDDLTGLKANIPGYMVAAAIAGLWAGMVNEGDSITNLTLRGLGVEWIPSPADLETMLANGVCPLEFRVDRQAITVTRGISTWLQDSNFFRVEYATGFALDTLVIDSTTALQPFIGKKGTGLLLHRIASALETLLIAEEKLGVIVGDPLNDVPSWSDIIVTIQGDTVLASYTASPAVPVNFVGLTINATQFSSSFTLAAING